jgi:hypothetical protein
VNEICPVLCREAYAVKDINTNNQSELAFVYDWKDGCDAICTFTTLDLLEFTNGELSQYASLEIGRGGAVADDYRFNYTVYVSKGNPPMFVGVNFSKNTTLTMLNGYPSDLLKITKIK